MSNLENFKNRQDLESFTSEDLLQAACWEYAWNYHPQLRRHIWAVPNGGFRDMREAIKMKATGTLEGVWDMHIFYKRQFTIIEMKVGNNQLTVDRVVKGKRHYGQKEWGELMELHGAVKYVCRSLDQFKEIIQKIVT